MSGSQGADYTKANYAKANYAKANYAKANYAKTDYAKTDYAKTDYAKADYRKVDYSKLAGIILCVFLTVLLQVEIFHSSFAYARAVEQAKDLLTVNTIENGEELIRFHVVAHSDSEEDQALKRAVRDGILAQVSSQLAQAQSLEESRRILTGLRPEMEEISRRIIRAWGKDYEVKTEYGNFIFPTKSYGSLILPAGEYEAVKVVIGEGKGSNWWCVLFPPLCFVDIEHSTAQQVDGKPGIPYVQSNVMSGKNQVDTDHREKEVQGSPKTISTETIFKDKMTKESKPKVRFWIVEKIRSTKL